MLKFAFNAIDDGLIGQQVFAGEIDPAGVHDRRGRRGPRRLPGEAPPGLVPLPLLLLTPSHHRLVRVSVTYSATEILTSRRLDHAVQPVAGVAEARDDVADVVELLVHGGDDQGAGHVQVVQQRR